MRNHPFDTFDREYLAELIRDFPVSPPISVDDALQQLKDRSQQWSPFEFVDTVRNKSVNFSFEEALPDLPRFLHRQIFKGILSNAGCYRSSQDKYRGYVEFGQPAKKLSDGAGCSNSRFQGIDSSLIEEKIAIAVRQLVFDGADPVGTAAKFYQQFVRIHPFFDGNGRIGRFIVEAYLYYHNLYIRWGDMKRNGRWIKQLNYCHKRMTLQTMNTSYPFAIKWWVHHFQKYVHKIELDPDETTKMARE